jgi:hypothetical protein
MDQNIYIVFITILSLISTLLTLLIRTIYKSKCSHIKCCCIEIDRNVDLEKSIDVKRQNTELELSVDNIKR